MTRLRPMLAALAGAAVLLATLSPPSRAETGTLAQFDPPVLPEGLAVDASGTAYVGIATKGEIRRVAPDGGQSTLAKLEPGLGTLLGLAVDGQANVLAALASHNITRLGRARRLANSAERRQGARGSDASADDAERAGIRS